MTQTLDQSAASRSFDQARADAFVGKVVGDTVGLATTAMASAGDRLGFFKDLAKNGPSTSIKNSVAPGAAGPLSTGGAEQKCG